MDRVTITGDKTFIIRDLMGQKQNTVFPFLLLHVRTLFFLSFSTPLRKGLRGVTGRISGSLLPDSVHSGDDSQRETLNT